MGLAQLNQVSSVAGIQVDERGSDTWLMVTTQMIDYLANPSVSNKSMTVIDALVNTHLSYLVEEGVAKRGVFNNL